MLLETPENEPAGTPDALTSAIKTESTPAKLDAVPAKLEAVPAKPASSAASPAGTPTPVSDIPAPLKTEPVQSPDVPSLAQSLSIAIPAATDGNVLQATAVSAAAAPLSIGTDSAQSSVPAHMHHPTVPTPAISPLSDIAPTKRSRTPEVGEETNAEKRQKTEHTEEQEATPDAEAKSDDEAGGGLFGWDLGAQLSSVLGAVEPETMDDANGSTEENKLDVVLPVSLLPPPRKRLEKMKFIENPTYFSRAMGLPMLGSLVSARTDGMRWHASLTRASSLFKFYSRFFNSPQRSQTGRFAT